MSADSDHSFNDDRDDPCDDPRGGRVDSPEEFVDALAAHEREGARLALDAVRIAAGGLWAGDGHVSMGAWLRDRCRMRSSDATQLLSDGRFLAANTIVAAAAVTGRLSAGQVRALRVVVKPATAGWFNDHQEMLVGGVEQMNVADAENTCQKWRAYAEAVADMPEPVIPERSWRSARAGDGTVLGRFVFDPAAAVEMEHALQTASKFNGAGDARTSAMRAADAAIEIFAFFNANHAGEGTPRHRPDVTINIHIEDLTTTHPTTHPATHPGTGTDADSDPDSDPDSYPDSDPDSDADDSTDDSTDVGARTDADDGDGEGPDAQHTDAGPGSAGPGSVGPGAWFVAHGFTRDGRPLPQWTTEAYLCDCVLHRMLHAESGVLDIGRSTRTVPLPMWRAVAARDGGCRHPGCDRPTRYADAHHITWWRRFGETKLDNLLMLCSYHHHLIHRQNWQIRLLANADAEFITPDGRTLASKPHGQPTIRAA